MEDAGYLKKYGKEESFLFVVDSQKRDMYADPNPSEYTIEFNAPFKNVIGIELLDATIPRTEYTIDDTYNTLVYSTSVDDTKKTVTVPPGDYNLLQLAEAMNPLLENGLVLAPETAPYTQTARAVFTCPNSFTLYMNESSIRNALGFPGVQKLYESTNTDAVQTNAFKGPFPGSTVFRIETGIVVRQPVTITDEGLPSAIVVYADPETSSTITARIVDADGTVYGTATIDPTVTPDAVVENPVTVLAGSSYYLELESSGGADVFINTSGDGIADVETAATSEGPWTVIEEDSACACQIFVDVMQHAIVSPGIVDLTGPRYIMVRCPDVESRLHRDRAYETFYAGLGMVKLGANGYMQQRFDFVSFPARRMTSPIAKLSKLTFRLEKADGTLYNSRGINHTLLVVIRYYAGIEVRGLRGARTPTQSRVHAERHRVFE